MLPRSSVIALFLVFTHSCAANDIWEPVFIVFDQSGETPEQRLSRVLLINEHLPVKYRRVMSPELVERLSTRFYRFADPSGFTPVSGVAYCVSGAGSTRSVRFRTVASPESFDVFLQEQIARRGPAAEVKRSGNRAVVSVPGHERRPGGVVVRWTDAYFSYDNGVVVWGEEEAFRVSPARLGEFCRFGKGSDWCLYAAPSKWTDDTQLILLGAITAAANVALQQRDGEDHRAYLTRQTAEKLIADLCTMAVTDVTEVVLAVTRDYDKAGYAADMKIVIQRDSSLAEFVKSLAPQRPFSRIRSNSPILSMSAAVRGSTPLGSALKAMAERYISSGALRNALRHFDHGAHDFNVSANVCLTPQQEPELYAVFDGEVESDTIQSPAEVASNASQPDHGRQIPFSASIGGRWNGEYLLSLTPVDGRTEVLLTPVSQSRREHKPYLAPADSRVARNDDSFVMLSIHGDLSPLAGLDRTAPVSVLIADIENTYGSWLRRRALGDVNHSAWASAGVSHSFATSVGKDGDWTFSLEVHVASDGGEVRGRLRIGRELYGLLLAREHLSQASLIPRAHGGH